MRPRFRDTVASVRGAREVAVARRLVEEYLRSLPINLDFQGVRSEVEGFPGEYRAPRGGLWIARVRGRPAGVIALRPFRGDACEMKRLYVRPRYRGRGLGRKLAGFCLRAAGRAGYARMLLDTLPSMGPALALYAGLGFRRTRRYRFNPVADAVFLVRRLRPRRVRAAARHAP